MTTTTTTMMFGVADTMDTAAVMIGRLMSSHGHGCAAAGCRLPVAARPRSRSRGQSLLFGLDLCGRHPDEYGHLAGNSYGFPCPPMNNGGKD